MTDNWGCVILAGGKGRRMGNVNKSEIQLEGRSFQGIIGAQLQALGHPCFLSQANNRLHYTDLQPERWRILIDGIADPDGNYIGPLGGITSCLEQSGMDGLFIVPCDMPFFNKEIILRILREQLIDQYDAIIFRTRNGKMHPACGWFSASCLPHFREDIYQGKYKLMLSVLQTHHLILDTAPCGFPDYWFSNVNTLDDYERLKSIQQSRQIAMTLI